MQDALKTKRQAMQAFNSLGRTYEVRGNGADGSQWGDKPLYGWITHLPAGWAFTPAPGTRYMPDGRFYPDFESAFPRWTGGLVGTWSEEVGVGQARAAI
jgi:hypothetical protein